MKCYRYYAAPINPLTSNGSVLPVSCGILYLCTQAGASAEKGCLFVQQCDHHQVYHWDLQNFSRFTEMFNQRTSTLGLWPNRDKIEKSGNRELWISVNSELIFWINRKKRTFVRFYRPIINKVLTIWESISYSRTQDAKSYPLYRLNKRKVIIILMVFWGKARSRRQLTLSNSIRLVGWSLT